MSLPKAQKMENEREELERQNEAKLQEEEDEDLQCDEMEIEDPSQIPENRIPFEQIIAGQITLTTFEREGSMPRRLVVVPF